MKNTAINTLTYTGIVTLSQYIGTKKVKIAQMHNTGGTSLFSFLANCLAGDFTLAKPNLPTKIKIIRRTRPNAEIDEYVYSSASSYIFLRTPPEAYSNAGESRVRFSFIIPRDFLEVQNLISSSTSSEVLGLGLYANGVPDTPEEAENFMAFCILENIEQTIAANAVLTVDWELVISNSQSTVSK